MQSNNQKSMHLTTAGALILDKMLPCGRAKNYIDFFSHFLKKSMDLLAAGPLKTVVFEVCS